MPSRRTPLDRAVRSFFQSRDRKGADLSVYFAKLNKTIGHEMAAEKPGKNSWLALRAGLLIDDNPRIRRELLIVREGGVAFLVEALQQQEARRRGEGLALRQPDFAVHVRVFHMDARTLVDARQKTAEGNGIDRFGIHAHCLAAILG